MFIIEDEKGAEKSQSPQEKTVLQSNAPAANPPQGKAEPISTPIVASEGRVSQKFLNVLLGAMDKNNLEGFDYLEYRQSLQNLSKMAMDEATRYKSAFAAAQTMGATPQKLIDTAGHYLRILKEEENKFGQALANQRKRQIGGKEEQYKKMQQSIKDKRTRILQLQKEIEQHETQMATVKDAVQKATIKVSNTQNDFVTTYNSIVDKIKEDVQKMKQYLA
ncbi:MAG: hypothetical protein AAFV95_16325 [Bacteroidota bacterium]